MKRKKYKMEHQVRVVKISATLHSINPLRPGCATFLAELCNPITRQAIELESCSNLVRIQEVF